MRRTARSSYRPSEQRFGVRATGFVTSVGVLDLRTGVGEGIIVHTSIGDSCARHQCLCTGAEDLIERLVVNTPYT